MLDAAGAAKQSVRWTPNIYDDQSVGHDLRKAKSKATWNTI